MNSAKIIDYGERAFLVLLIAPFLISFARYLPTHSYSIALAISEALAVGLILIRKPGEVIAKPYPLVAALAGTAIPLFARPGGFALIPPMVALVVMFAGLLINVTAKMALNRSFGLIAANRGVKRGGPYRFVRHPMYLGYFITQLGFLLSNFYLGLLALYAAAWSAQLLRIVEEERILSVDPEYRLYAENVPRKVLPGF